jgi:hypothetical protein
LELVDEDPYDGASAERIFPEASKKEISFLFQAKNVALGYSLQIEVQDQNGKRPLALRIDKDWLSFDLKKVEVPAVQIKTGIWYHITLNIDCSRSSYQVKVNGKKLKNEIEFADQVRTIERIVFSTVPYRGYVPSEYIEEGTPGQNGLDIESLPGAGEKVQASIYFIDDLITKGDYYD